MAITRFKVFLYDDVHTLTVIDPDYKPYSQPVVLKQERLVVDIMLTPLKDPVVELQGFLTILQSSLSR